MRFLLTSNSISNPSIEHALVDLLGRPIAESSALCIPTGTHPFRDGPAGVYRFISGTAASPICGLGWKSLRVLDHASFPGNSLANLERWAAGIAGPAYAIDDETAIKVVDGTVEVVSEGDWNLFTS